MEEIGVETIKHCQLGRVFSNIMANGVTRIVIPYSTQIPVDSKFLNQKNEVVDIKWFSFEDVHKLNWAYDHKDVFNHALESGEIDGYLTRDIKSIIGDWEEFLSRIFEDLKAAKIEVNEFELDHIAYRAITNESFEAHCKMLDCVCKRLNRNTIRNRYVDVYEFNTPLIYKGRTTRYIELLAPADGDEFSEGLEHAEFIVNGYKLREILDMYPNFEWNTNSLNRKIGPDIGIKLTNGYGVKFKTQSFAEVVRLENLAK